MAQRKPAKVVLQELAEREAICWARAQVYIDQHDFHGMHDEAIEIAALRRAVAEIERCETAPGWEKPAPACKHPRMTQEIDRANNTVHRYCLDCGARDWSGVRAP